MIAIRYIFLVITIVATINVSFFAQFKFVTKPKDMNENVNSPEALVKSFIEDYFRWNNTSSGRAKKISDAETSALSVVGISEPITKLEESKMLKYAEIKGQTSTEYVKLIPQVAFEYQKIIEKYCRPKHKSLNSAFGGESSHDPNNEIIVSVTTINGKSIVNTKRTSKTGGNRKFVSDYEFYLTYENERWYLERIFYVTDEGKYESL